MTLTLSKSRSTQNHHLNKLCRPHIPDATYQVPRSLTFWFWRRRFLKGFYHIWAWRPSWSCDQDHLNKLSFPHPKESPYEISVQLAQLFQRRRYLKMLTDDGRTDAGVIGILIAHLGAFGSGELKNHANFNSMQRVTSQCLIFMSLHTILAIQFKTFFIPRINLIFFTKSLMCHKILF